MGELERIAMAIHREWSRHTYRQWTKHGPETENDAHARRWRTLPERTRAEFMREAAAVQAVLR